VATSHGQLEFPTISASDAQQRAAEKWGVDNDPFRMLTRFDRLAKESAGSPDQLSD
jgi:hypothetical protein